VKLWGSSAKKVTGDNLITGDTCGGATFEVKSVSGAARIVWCSGCDLAMAYAGDEVVTVGNFAKQAYAFLGDAIFNTGVGTDKGQANADFRDLLYELAENDPTTDQEPV
jgi:hypothetical protein